MRMFLIKCNIMEMQGSFAATDPKGELLGSAGNYLKANGYQIKVFNLISPKESNTRTVVTFCAMFIEAQGIYIDSELFKDNARYMRDALVAASASFSDLGDRRKPEYLYRIVGDALERGKAVGEDAVQRIRSAGYPAGEQQVRKVIFWDRKERRIHGADEIRQLLRKKEREEPGLER